MFSVYFLWIPCRQFVNEGTTKWFKKSYWAALSTSCLAPLWRKCDQHYPLVICHMGYIASESMAIEIESVPTKHG